MNRRSFFHLLAGAAATLATPLKYLPEPIRHKLRYPHPSGFAWYSGHETLTPVITATLRNRIPQLQESFNRPNPLLERLKKRRNV